MTNSFGDKFRITTWGESHGEAIGLVIDGCPSGLPLAVDDLLEDLKRRAPGQSPYTSPRKEPDVPQILSGVFEGKTTGAPISIVIANQDVQSGPYEAMRHLLRPGHAAMTYQEKYGHYDPRGGGRASARETACRVIAGAIAKKLLKNKGVAILAYLKGAGPILSTKMPQDLDQARQLIAKSPVYAFDQEAGRQIEKALTAVHQEGDSLGGIVEVLATGVPAGLGEPIYGKIEAKIASAMMSIPASKGVEIGAGFAAATMKGSECNDAFYSEGGKIYTKTNHAGGTLGGISTGMPLIVRVAFKPTSSIALPQKTVTTKGQETTFTLPPGARHDPCVAIRAVPVVEAMLACVLANF